MDWWRLVFGAAFSLIGVALLVNPRREARRLFEATRPHPYTSEDAFLTRVRLTGLIGIVLGILSLLGWC